MTREGEIMPQFNASLQVGLNSQFITANYVMAVISFISLRCPRRLKQLLAATCLFLPVTSFALSPPIIDSVNPPTMTASTSALTTLTLTGSNFSTSGGQLLFTDPSGNLYSSAAHPERIVSITSTQWAYQINNGGTTGTWQVQVINADGQSSNSESFQVDSGSSTQFPPLINSVNPLTMTASTSALTTLTITGSNFSTSGGHLLFTDPSGNLYSSATYPARIVSITATQWAYQINNGGTTGTWHVQVINADGQSSNSLNFQVTGVANAANGVLSYTIVGGKLSAFAKLYFPTCSGAMIQTASGASGSFTGLADGNYCVEAYNNDSAMVPSPVQEYWGNQNATVSGGKGSVTINRIEPHGEKFEFLKADTGTPISDIGPGINVEARLQVINNASTQRSVSGLFNFRDGTDNTTVTSCTPTAITLPPGATGYLECNFTPMAAGTWERQIQVKSNVSASYPVTDSWPYSESDILSVASSSTPPLFSKGNIVMAGIGVTKVLSSQGDIRFTQTAGVHGVIIDGPLPNPGFKGDGWQIKWDAMPPAVPPVALGNGEGWSSASVIQLAPSQVDTTEPHLFSEPDFTTLNPLWTDGKDAPGTAKWPLPDAQGWIPLGNCTWYAYGRMLELGATADQIGTLIKDAGKWLSLANDAHLPINLNTNPYTHSIAWKADSNPDCVNPGGKCNGDGHVAVVESVNSDGTITVTESSYVTKDLGLNVGNYLWRHRTVAPTYFSNFILIPGISIPPATTPSAPTIQKVTAGDAFANVSFNIPTSDGGTTITGYTVSSSPAGGVDSNAGSTTTTHTITGLTNGTSYTFTVVATNSAGGQSTPSDPSYSVSPSPLIASYTVSASAGPNGAISPSSQPVTQGDTISFTVTPDSGYQVSVSGCGGSLSGNTYTTGPVTADCAVTATFTAVPSSQKTLTGISIIGPSSVNSGSSANYLLDASYSDGSTSQVTGMLSLAATSYATLSNGILTAGTVTIDQTVTLNGSYLENGVTETTSRSVTISAPVSNTFVIQPGPSLGKDTFYGTVYVTNGNYQSDSLYIGGWGDYYYDFIQFDLTGAPSSADTVKAELWLYGSAPNDPALQIERITEPWTAAGVNISSIPASSYYKNLSPVLSNSGWVVTDITDLYKGWMDGTYPNDGIELIPTSNNQTNGSFASSDNADPTTRPKLVITTNTPGMGTSTTTINFIAGWNLVGNGESNAVTVSTAFGDPTQVTTVWKWETKGTNANITYPAWAFYTPTLTDGGSAYAASKGYDFLTIINPGEGFWVNANTAFTAPLTGNAVPSVAFQDESGTGGTNPLPSGWSLISVGDSPTPAAFNVSVGATPPATGMIPTNITTIWSWNATGANWYFYAPSLDAKGGTALSDYISSKNYLNFGTSTLTPTTGFWVNHP